MNDTLEIIWDKILNIGYETVNNDEKYKDKWKYIKNKYKNYGIYKLDSNNTNLNPGIPIIHKFGELFKYDLTEVYEISWPKNYPDRWLYESTRLYHSLFEIVHKNKYNISLLKFLKIAFSVGILKYTSEINKFWVYHKNKLADISTYISQETSKFKIVEYVVID